MSVCHLGFAGGSESRKLNHQDMLSSTRTHESHSNVRCQPSPYQEETFSSKNTLSEILIYLPPLTDFRPYHEYDSQPEARYESEQHEHISVVVVRPKAEELTRPNKNQSGVLKPHRRAQLTVCMMRDAETLTGTPSSESSIISPEPTSLTESASRVYFNGQSHCSQRRTGGMSLRCTKKPAYVIW